VCGSCGKPVAARHNRRGAQLIGYGCINRDCGEKVHRAMKYVDAFVEGWVVEKLADPRVRQAMAPDISPHLVQELERLERKRDRLFEQLADADDAFMENMRRITVPALEARIGEIRASLSSRLAVRAVNGLFGVSLDEFRRLPLPRRRAVVRATARVTILRSGRRGPVFDPGSVRIEASWV